MAKPRTLLSRLAQHPVPQTERTPSAPRREKITSLSRIACALLPLFPATLGFAQGPARHADVIFQNLGRESGLPSPIVQAVAQDGHGFLWIGTGSGISRWDGYHFRTYSVQVGVPGALPDNDVYSMYTDPQGTLWIGTRSRGVARYESDRDEFQTFAPAGKEKSYATVYAMMTDNAQGLLIGSREGLSDLNPSTGTFTHVQLEGAKGRIAVLTLVRDR